MKKLVKVLSLVKINFLYYQDSRLAIFGLIQQILRPLETYFEKIVAEDVTSAAEKVPGWGKIFHLK